MLAGGTVSTFPPDPSSPALREPAATARAALFGGRPDRAYRMLLSNPKPEGTSGEDAEVLARCLVALDRPLEAAALLARFPGEDPSRGARLRVLLDRSMGLAGRINLTVRPSPPPEVDRKTLRSAVAAAPAPDGGSYLLTRTAFLSLDSSGKVTSSRAFPGGTDLCLDEAGKPLALGKGVLLWGDRTIPLDPSLGEPTSAVALPEGNLALLDSRGRRLLKVDPRGVALGSARLTLSEPQRVRADWAGRIYVADGASGRVHVFGGDLAPLSVIDPASRGILLRSLRDFHVDFAGNVLLLDGRAKRLFLFSHDGKLLWSSVEDSPRIRCVGWDGLDEILFVEDREGRLGRIEP